MGAEEFLGATLARGFAPDSVQWPLVRSSILFELRYGKALVETSRRPGPVPVFGTNGRCGSHDTALFAGPGVVCGRKGQGPLGVEWVDSDYWVIDTAYSLRPLRDDVDLKFAYYLVKYVGLNHLKDGTSNPSLSRDTFGSQLFPVPPVPEQRAIARILCALDDKIELNSKMNATLEAMARALFKSWFVDFDPVRAKSEGRTPSGMDAETASLFPSEFVESELGSIPKGWEAGRIGDVIEIHDSRRVPLSSREREQRRGDFPYYGATSVMDYVDAFLFDGRFVLVGEDGSVVTPEGLPFTQYVWGRFWVNNHAHVLTGVRGFSQEHLFLLFQQTNIAAYVTGAVQAKLSQGNMRKIPLVVAPDAVNAKFGSVLDPLFARFRALTEESRTLARLRDELLPRLLSGSLDVGPLVDRQGAGDG
ncbi:MAG: restriction endonuclease subunit S [Myxococcales bacterium]|nr:restriction endonuclease subunit S [Myxococcales bacterium]